MKLLIAGYGSIGRVHAANARMHGPVAVLDAERDAWQAAEADGIETIFTALDEALVWQPDGLIVATPPDTHLAIAEAALRAGPHVLIEKPIAHNMDRIGTFLAKSAASTSLAYVVCNMRYHPAIAEMTRRIRDVGKPLFARAHYGHFLPHMRPAADYRRLYSARRAKGGGVIRDAIHEIDYLMWWFGPVDEVNCTAARQSDLDIDVEDYAVIVLRHESGVRSEIHLDYLRRRKARGCEICGTEASLIWESDGKAPEHCRVSRLWNNDASPELLLNEPALDSGTMYRQLMMEFTDAIAGKPTTLATVEEGASALAVTLAALESAMNGRPTAPARAAA